MATQMTLPASRYATHVERAHFVQALLEQVESIPGVLSAGVTTNIPLQFVSFDSIYTVEGRAPDRAGNTPITAHRVVSPSYLQTLGVTLLRGRLLQRTDDPQSQRVVVVTEELARQAWPGEDPIGKRIRRGRIDETTRPWLTVVGLVADVKEDRGNFRITRAAWYLPYAQEDSTAPINLVVNARVEPTSLAALIRERTRSVDPEVALSDSITMDRQVAEVMLTERFAAILLMTLAAAGLLLAVLGLYGVIAHSVQGRVTEIALRLAVGARPGDVVRMIVRDAGILAALGVSAGALIAISVGRALQSILHEIAPTDAVTFAGAAGAVMVAAMLAAYVPARRAAGLDPARALR